MRTPHYSGHSNLSQWCPVTQLSDKDTSLLEEKIRRYGKKVPQATPPAPPTVEAPPTSDQTSGPALGGKGRGKGGGGGVKIVSK